MAEKMIERAYNKLLSPKFKHGSERIILGIAIGSYILHLVLILLASRGIIQIDTDDKFFENPIAAIYTPFSFILVYEVYLLIFFLPQSISIYIGKQYEIITLIVIRRIFKDIANIELTSNWFEIKYDLQFTYDVVTSLILFGLIYLFYQNIKRHSGLKIAEVKTEKINRFVTLKKTMAVLLVPILVILAFYTLFHWLTAVISDYQNGVIAFKNLNNIFFDEFFTVLIIADVLLLLASFFYSDKFHKIIRNSGFVISTILIKLSFSVDGIVNNALIIGAVLFGFLILLLHNKYEHSAKTDNL